MNPKNLTLYENENINAQAEAVPRQFFFFMKNTSYVNNARLISIYLFLNSSQRIQIYFNSYPLSSLA